MDDEESEKTGYKKPPAHGRFKRGNQAGRRQRKPRLPNLYDEFQKVMRRKVTLNIGGVPQKITIRRALLIRLRGEAQKGVKWALRFSQKLIDTVPPPPEDLKAEGEKAELAKIMLDLAIEDALRKHYPPEVVDKHFPRKGTKPDN